MTCYQIARKIMDMIRGQMEYDAQTHKIYHGVGYYDSSVGSEYFVLIYDGVRAHIYEGKIRYVEILNPRGIVSLNLYLWLQRLDRMTK